MEMTEIIVHWPGGKVNWYRLLQDWINENCAGKTEMQSVKAPGGGIYKDRILIQSQ